MSYGLGTTAENILSHEQLGLPVPSEALPVDYESFINLGDGIPFGQGGLAQEQRYPLLTYAEYAVFKTYCPGAGAVVYVRTRKTLTTWAVYEAVMNMTSAPADDKVDILKDVVIKYTRMVEVV